MPIWRLSAGASPWALLPLLTLPLATRLMRAVATQEGRQLNAALKGTGRLHLAFGVLFAASLLM